MYSNGQIDVSTKIPLSIHFSTYTPNATNITKKWKLFGSEYNSSIYRHSLVPLQKNGYTKYFVSTSTYSCRSIQFEQRKLTICWKGDEAHEEEAQMLLLQTYLMKKRHEWVALITNRLTSDLLLMEWIFLKTNQITHDATTNSTLLHFIQKKSYAPIQMPNSWS